jgi:Fe-S cluster assembly iron-binding protein IscA
MLSLTHAARQHVADLLSKAGAGKVLRISSSPEGIRFAIDRVRIGDNTFNDGDKCILAIDQMVLRSVTGKTLDVEIDDGQPTLVLLGE